MAGHFRSSVWDPSLIVAQMLTMQCFFYLSLGFWIFMTDFIAGTYRSLDHLLEFQFLQLKDFYGRLILGAYLFNALTGALGLWYVIQRTKQCWDFTVTVYFFHFLISCIHTGALPSTFTWWLVNIICIILMTVLGEFLCMRTELQVIPLALGPKVDL